MNKTFQNEELAVRLDRLDQRIATGVKQLHDRISMVESKLNARLDEQERQAGKRGAELATRVEGTAAGFKHVDYALDILATQIGNRIAVLEGRLEKHISLLESNVDRIAKHFSS